MNPILSSLIFYADLVSVAILAWRSFCFLERHYLGLVETTLGWILLGLTWIVGAGVILGLTGGLGGFGFFAFHAVSLALFCFFQRGLAQDARRASAFISEWRRMLACRS